jgi:hypothetical protein
MRCLGEEETNFELVMIFSFGQSERERIEVDVLRYERSPNGDFHDSNWLAVKIEVQAGGFHGKADAAILTSEVKEFTSEVRTLFETLRGSANFQTLEGQLSLELTGDGKGHIELTGEVRDQPGIGNRLRFTLQIDQSQLGQSLREIEGVISKFPVRTN